MPLPFQRHQSPSQHIPKDPTIQPEAPRVQHRRFHQPRISHDCHICEHRCCKRLYSLHVSLCLSLPRVRVVERLGDFTTYLELLSFDTCKGCWDYSEGGLCACFVFCLSEELSDLITKTDVLRRLKLVVLQLSHVMRITHQRRSVGQRNSWSGFEYCSLFASVVTRVSPAEREKRFC